MKKASVLITAGLVILFSFTSLIKPIFSPSLHQKLSKIAILEGGREKPLDSLSRNTLVVLSSKQKFKYNAKTIESQEWIWDVFLNPAKADDYPVFRIDSPEILGMLGLESGKEKFFSFKKLTPFFDIIQEQATQADGVEAQARNRIQKDIIQLRNKLALYFQLKNSIAIENLPNFNQDALAFLNKSSELSPIFQQNGHTDTTAFTPEQRTSMQHVLVEFNKYKYISEKAYFRLVPGSLTPSKQWLSMGDGLIISLSEPKIRPFLTQFIQLSESVKTNHPNPSLLAQFTAFKSKHVELEWLFNQWNPFYYAICIYFVLFLMVFFAWLFVKPEWFSWIYGGLLGTFIIHSAAILCRMLIQGRPPVTNLYTSAVFVGWMAILIGLILERFYKNGIGSIVSASIGFLTLIIAHHLSLQGDTLEMMQAVLDSNFWLSTHVVTITIGYSACFLAGVLAHVYIFRGVFSKSLDTDTQKQLAAMVYATVCFALFFSAVGTILGGIWADQSWGRFWGWDPKENGALLIVLWNAIILHARWGGFIKQRGLMLAAVFGNIITSFSWFGVNMLGVGLHSYGFMDKAFFWLMLFVFVQLVVIWVGSLPAAYWKSKI